MAETLQIGRRRGGKLVKLAFPSRATFGGNRADHNLLEIAGLSFCLRDLIGRQITASVKLVEVRNRGTIAGIDSNGLPDVGGEAILRNPATIAQGFSVKVLGLRQPLIGCNLV